MNFPSIASYKTAEALDARLRELSAPWDCEIGCDRGILAAPDSPLAEPIKIFGRRAGNRFAIHPMEGWDGTAGGMPSEWTERRWRNFGISGAKLIWGGEAVAVDREGRANPHQLYYSGENKKGLAKLLEITRRAHRERYGSDDDLIVGLQLTHSGRFARPGSDGASEPRIVHAHPVLDRALGVDGAKAMMSDMELDDLVGKFVAASRGAREMGFDFVDVKHCHGYLLHELLAAKTRPGRYGGALENRARFLKEVASGIRRDAPGLAIGVRLSVFDTPPPIDSGRDIHGFDPADYTFGLFDQGSVAWDTSEPFAFLALCSELGIDCINATAGSPYYSAHFQRPASYPPIDAVESDLDPLIGAALQLRATAQCKAAYPDLTLVGSAYSYFQDYVPHVAQDQVRRGNVDVVGLGRMVLAYPDLPDDVLVRGELGRKRICRTFSDCTNGPRVGFISGCYPLDKDYKSLPEWAQLRALKKKK